MKSVPLLLLLMAPLTSAQMDKEGTAGACSPVVTSNTKQIVIDCPGASAEEKRKLVQILDRLLTNRTDLTQVLAQLNEINQPISLNRSLTAKQVVRMRLFLSQGEPQQFEMICDRNDGDSFKLATQLSALLVASGWTEALPAEDRKTGANRQTLRGLLVQYHGAPVKPGTKIIPDINEQWGKLSVLLREIFPGQISLDPRSDLAPNSIAVTVSLSPKPMSR